MDELHLFQDGRFARFTGTYNTSELVFSRVRYAIKLTKKEHLDLIPLRHLVALELIVDLIVPCLAGIVLLARSATHRGEIVLLEVVEEV